MVKETLSEVKKRKNFYRDNFRWSLKMLYRVLILATCLIVIDAYLLINRPKEDFYATNSVGLITALTAMDKPNFSPEPLLPSIEVDPEEQKQKNMNWDL